MNRNTTKLFTNEHFEKLLHESFKNDSFEKLLKYYEDSKIKLYIYHNIGLIYSYKGEYDKSLMYYKKSLELANKYQKDEDVISRIYNSLGLIFDKKGRYKEALEVYNKAIQIQQRIGNLFAL